METISRKKEDEIINSISDAVQIMNREGKTPNQAIEKVARDGNWGPGLVRFASTAYNTGRQNHQRESSDKVLDKVACFDIANPDVIISNIWPETPKTAGDEWREGVSLEYSAPPRFFRKKVAISRNRSLFTKAASTVERGAAVGDNDERPSDAPDKFHDVKESFKSSREYSLIKTDLERSEKEASDLLRLSRKAGDNLKRYSGRLADYFRSNQDGHVKFAEFESCANEYHPNASGFLECLYNQYQLKEKRADDSSFASYSPNLEPYRLLDRSISSAQQSADYRQRYKDKVAECESIKGKLDLHVKKNRELTVSDTERMFQGMGRRIKYASIMAGVAAGGAISGTKRLLDSALGPEAKRDRIQAEVSKISDPSHENELRAIRAQAVVAELMDDDIISGYSPDDVVSTYNEISSFAPRIATQPIVMRSLMRRHLAGNVEPFEAGDLAKIEQTFKDQSSDTKPESAPQQAGGPSGSQKK